MKCQKCNEEIVIESRFCNWCGAAQTATAEPRQPRPPRPGGSPEYIIARYMQPLGGPSSLDDAMTLSRLALRFGGNAFPVAKRGKKATLNESTAMRLVRGGWLTLSADVEYLPEVTWRAIGTTESQAPYTLEHEVIGHKESVKWWAQITSDTLEMIDAAWAEHMKVQPS